MIEPLEAGWLYAAIGPTGFWHCCDLKEEERSIGWVYDMKILERCHAVTRDGSAYQKNLADMAYPGRPLAQKAEK